MDANAKRVIARRNTVNVSKLAFYAILISANAVIAKIQWKNWRTGRKMMNFCKTLRNSTNTLIEPITQK